MIDRLIEFSARNKFVVFLLVGFAVAWGMWSMQNMPLDAIPDLSDTQVIVYSRWDRSPDIMEDQVTYPIVTAMLGAPKVKDVRGFSDFGYSYVYIIFDEGTDIYWARSRTLEYLSAVLPRLPQGVKTELGPDATGVGWVFQYALVDTHGQAQSRRAALACRIGFCAISCERVPGVAEVAPLGGFVRQYQVNVDPNKLQAYNIPIMKVVEAVRGGNNDVGGRLVEMAGARIHGARPRLCASRLRTSAASCWRPDPSGVPVRVSDVGHVKLGPDLRRGIADWNGKGEAVTGIVIMRAGRECAGRDRPRQGQAARDRAGLPAGVKIVTAYDRSELILRSIDNLKHTLIEEMIIVSHGDPDFPLALSQRHHSGLHHSHRHRDCLHSHAA